MNETTLSFTRRNLPHWLVAERTHFVTFRLHGSLPRSVLVELRLERERLRQQFTESDPAWQTFLRQEFLRIERILDTAQVGANWLAQSAVAQMVFENFAWLEKTRGWRIWAGVVMSNHVHLLLRNEAGHTAALLDDLAHFKRFTARAGNALLSRAGPFWAREDFDHWCRSQAKVESAARYIRDNPVKAGLLADWRKWPWLRYDLSVFWDAKAAGL
jgi:putative transposase